MRQRRPQLILGTVRGVEKRANRGSETERIMLQVEFANRDDVQAVELAQSGRGSYPVEGDRAYVLDAGRSYKLAVLLRDVVLLELAAGEEGMYSRDSEGELAASVIARADGTVEVNGDAESAVRFAQLQEAFDELRSDFNSLVSTFNTHAHTGVTTGGGTSGTTTETGSSSDADMSDAESDTVRIP